MEISFTLSLIAAVLSPLFFGLMNILDKYVVSKKVNKPLSYGWIVGCVELIFGVIFALFLDWSINLKDIFFPAIAGILFGSQFYFYFIIMKKEDASYIVGLIYTYPLFVALFSFLFLKEIISLLGYLGMAFMLLGVLIMSVRIKKIKFKASLWTLLFFILTIAISEIFVKVSTTNLNAFNGIAVNLIFMGLTVQTMLFSKSIRKGISSELKNLKYAIFIESFTFFAVLTLYVGMVNLQATVVASIASTQPLLVLFFERMIDRFGGKISRDHLLLPKLGSILLIVIGVLLIYWQEIVKLLLS